MVVMAGAPAGGFRVSEKMRSMTGHGSSFTSSLSASAIANKVPLNPEDDKAQAGPWSFHKRLKRSSIQRM